MTRRQFFALLYSVVAAFFAALLGNSAGAADRRGPYLYRLPFEMHPSGGFCKITNVDFESKTVTIGDAFSESSAPTSFAPTSESLPTTRLVEGLRIDIYDFNPTNRPRSPC